MISLNKFLSSTKVIAVAIVVGQSIGLAPLAVLAADNEIRVAGQSIFAITSPSGGMTPEQRVETIQRNLDNALVASKDRSPSSVAIVYVKGMPVVTLGGYQVMAVDQESAKASQTTPALLAQNFADGLRQVLGDGASVDSYVAQLSGEAARGESQQASDSPAMEPGPAPRRRGAYPADYSTYRGQYQSQMDPDRGQGPPSQYRGRVAYIPAGMTIPVVLRTSISTQAARSGDLVEAQINQPIGLGDATIPPGSIVTGIITEADPGRRLNRSGDLGIKFTALRTPDGAEAPITAHIAGGVGKYKQLGSDQSGVVKGEGFGTKAGQFALRTALGAGAGAALGTAVGAIASHGHHVGTGAWSGTAIGGGLGAADALLLRKGKDVTIPSGAMLNLQLDAPAQVSCSGGPPYTGSF